MRQDSDIRQRLVSPIARPQSLIRNDGDNFKPPARSGSAGPARPWPHGRSTFMPRGKHRRLVTMVAGALAVAVAAGPAPAGAPTHAIAMQGAPAMPAGFTAFPYVTPSAPKGGALGQGALGPFDSLHLLI